MRQKYSLGASIVILLVAWSLVAQAPSSLAAPAGDSLSQGGTLVPGQRLVSPNGRFELVMQADGNLAEYFLGRPVWSTGTFGTNLRAVLQSDGNFVVYRPDNSAAFNTGTGGTGANLLRIQDDGNLVIYSPGLARWANHPDLSGLKQGQRLNSGQEIVSPNGQYRLIMQPDGNAVVYGPSGARWNSGTAGRGTSFATFQNDGNFVVYGPAGATYNVGIIDSSADLLILQSDGNLVIYSRGQALWSNGVRIASPNSFFLPFPAGTSNVVTQSPGGSFSHNDAYNRDAVDFGLPMASIVSASSSGTTYFAGTVSTGGGIMVLIDHGNDRCSQYSHLSQLQVRTGQVVNRGQTVGLSGNSGKASNPHLHWNLVSCKSQRSLEIINTVEAGTKYVANSRVTSQNR